MTIEEFTPVRRGTSLRGFARVRTPAGMVFHDVGVHVSSKTGNAWISPSSKPMLGRDGSVLRDPDGKVRYAPVVSFTDKPTRDRFSAAVLDALRHQYPEALAPAREHAEP